MLGSAAGFATGLVLGVVLLVGVGIKFSLLISALSGNSVIVAVVLIAVSSTFLGLFIAVSVSETKVRFATPEITLTSKVIDGTFPDYTRVIPTGNTKKMEVDAAEFAKAVDRVATVSSERSRAVKLQLDDDRLVWEAEIGGEIVVKTSDPDAGAWRRFLAWASKILPEKQL